MLLRPPPTETDSVAGLRLELPDDDLPIAVLTARARIYRVTHLVIYRS
jgi:hypothetical protein